MELDLNIVENYVNQHSKSYPILKFQRACVHFI